MFFGLGMLGWKNLFFESAASFFALAQSNLWTVHKLESLIADERLGLKSGGRPPSASDREEVFGNEGNDDFGGFCQKPGTSVPDKAEERR